MDTSNKNQANEKHKLLTRAEAYQQSISDNWKLMYELYSNNYRPNIPNYGAVVNTGKVFELTETFVGYFIQALMFQEKFFDASPLSVGSQQYSAAAVELLAELINTSNFTKVLCEALRQLILTGNTGMTVNIRSKRLFFECLDMFRTYLLPGHSPEFPNFIYKYVLSEVQLHEFWRTNKYIKDDYKTFKQKVSNETFRSDKYNNINRGSQEFASDSYEIYAHYQWHYDESKYTAEWFSREYLYEEPLKQHEIPVIAAAQTLPDSPYGYSPLESCVGLISELTALKSYRLTAAKIASWYMFTTNDNMIPDDLDFEPNKVFHTTDKESLQPLPMPANGYEVNAAEEQSLISTIYTNVGLGSGVSANVARQAERVTATEIDALQKASGSRLNLLFNVLEATLFSPIINYAAAHVSGMKGKRQLRIYNADIKAFDIYEAPYDLLKDFKIVLDCSSVKNRLETTQKLIDFMSVVANIPAAQDIIDFGNIVRDITHMYGLPNPERYIKQQPPTPPVEETAMMEEPTGINPDDNRIIQQMISGASGGDPSMVAMLAGDDPNDPQALLDASNESLLREQVSGIAAQEQEGLMAL